MGYTRAVPGLCELAIQFKLPGQLLQCPGEHIIHAQAMWVKLELCLGYVGLVGNQFKLAGQVLQSPGQHLSHVSYTRAVPGLCGFSWKSIQTARASTTISWASTTISWAALNSCPVTLELCLSYVGLVGNCPGKYYNGMDST